MKTAQLIQYGKIIVFRESHKVQDTNCVGKMYGIKK
jgi:hypothetical protein